MTSPKQHIFNYTGRQLIICCDELTSIDCQVVVVPTNQLLNATNKTSRRIYTAAGVTVQKQIEQLRQEYHQFETGMAVFTDAGDLPYSAIVHAICELEEEHSSANLVEQTYTNSLMVCEFNAWKSVWFEELHGGSEKHFASSAARAIVRFWDARMETAIETVVLGVPLDKFGLYIEAIEAINAGPLCNQSNPLSVEVHRAVNGDGLLTDSMVIGELDLSNEDVNELNEDSSISDWFSSNQDESH